MSKFVKFEDINNIRIITFDRPDKKNAFNEEMLTTVSNLIDETRDLLEIRVVIITSKCEKIFSSGYDISSDNMDSKESLLNIHILDESKDKHPLMKISEVISESPKIIIAAINGSIFGGALEVMLNCDFKFFSKESIFCMPPVKLGIFYNYFGLRNFINKIGVSNTKKIFFTGDKFNSDNALEMNLFDFIIDKDEVLNESIKFGEKISQNAPLSLASIKKSINTFESSQKVDKDEYEKIKKTIIKAANSSDYIEAQDAFKLKRTPKFTGE
ncbi:enoyl-CoA hydratase/isomerase family protein [bacterium]|nr:enoyl-CoA hydratase/isomerase family protein [bacterium]|tara:strand:+ start:24763 stop:25572 length:810 start_codon:yes stop_codon:yes gene_type:complete